MKRRRPAVSPWPIALGLLLLVAALGAAVWLRAQLAAQQETTLSGTVRRFELTGILGRPESRTVNFSDLETLVRASETSLLKRIYVTKANEEGDELAVHPFYIDLVQPGWREGTPWLRVPVGEPAAGYLYIEVDNSTLRAVDAVVLVLGLLLTGGLGVLLVRQWGKEVEISELSGQLEARRAQVIHMEKLALVGQLSANLLHDIKKPVLNIKHEVADALDGVGGDTDEVLRVVFGQTELYLEMMRDVGMESFVNAASEDLEWCDLGEILARSLRLVRYEQGDVEVECRLTEEPAFLIEAIPHRLVQLFSNLVLNAFQAMDGAGRLCIRTMATATHWVIEVEDSGPGIEAGQREALFSPFVTTRAKIGGSGLGLYICRQIAEDLGGTVAIADGGELGGACLVVRLPRPGDEPTGREETPQ